MNMISPLAGSSMWHADIETGKVRLGGGLQLTCTASGWIPRLSAPAIAQWSSPAAFVPLPPACHSTSDSLPLPAPCVLPAR